MEKTSSLKTLNLKTFKKYLLPRPQNATKWDFGHVLIIGGDYGMAGATKMAGEAALRTGAGLVSIATRPEHAYAISASRPELMAHGIKNINELKKLLQRSTVIVIGPGLGQSDWSKKLFLTALKTPKPKIIDADGLNLLAKNFSHKFISQNKNLWILTPHIKEAERLLHIHNLLSNNKLINRISIIKNLYKKYGGISILKGAGTLVFDGFELSICKEGNPGMATAGMGDILSGIIVGLVAQKIPLNIAAKLGVLLHAKAGDLAAKELGERGLIATDLLGYLHKLVN